MNYILNNWNERQLYQNNAHMKCSMESHISHIFADIFTSRPKAYSKKGLRKLLEIRLLKINGVNIKELYFKNIKKHEIFHKKKKITNKNIKNNHKIKKLKENKYDIQYETTLIKPLHNLKTIISI